MLDDRTLDSALRMTQTALDMAALADAMADELADIHDTAQQYALGSGTELAAYRDLVARLRASALRTRASTAEHWNTTVQLFAAVEQPAGASDAGQGGSLHRIVVDDVGRLFAYFRQLKFGFAVPTEEAEAAARSHVLAVLESRRADAQTWSAAVLDALGDDARRNAGVLRLRWEEHLVDDADASLLTLATRTLPVLTVTGVQMESLHAAVRRWEQDHPQPLQAGEEPADPPPAVLDARLEAALTDLQITFDIAAFLRLAADDPGHDASASLWREAADRMAAAAVARWTSAVGEVAAEGADDDATLDWFGTPGRPDGPEDPDAVLRERFEAVYDLFPRPRWDVTAAAVAHVQAAAGQRTDVPGFAARPVGRLVGLVAEHADENALDMGEALIRRLPRGANRSHGTVVLRIVEKGAAGFRSAFLTEAAPVADVEEVEAAPAAAPPRQAVPLLPSNLHPRLAAALRYVQTIHDIAAFVLAAADEVERGRSAAARAVDAADLRHLAEALQSFAEDTWNISARAVAAGSAPARTGLALKHEIGLLQDARASHFPGDQGREHDTPRLLLDHFKDAGAEFQNVHPDTERQAQAHLDSLRIKADPDLTPSHPVFLALGAHARDDVERLRTDMAAGDIVAGRKRPSCFGMLSRVIRGMPAPESEQLGSLAVGVAGRRKGAAKHVEPQTPQAAEGLARRKGL